MTPLSQRMYLWSYYSCHETEKLYFLHSNNFNGTRVFMRSGITQAMSGSHMVGTNKNGESLRQTICSA